MGVEECAGGGVAADRPKRRPEGAIEEHGIADAVLKARRDDGRGAVAIQDVDLAAKRDGTITALRVKA